MLSELAEHYFWLWSFLIGNVSGSVISVVIDRAYLRFEQARENRTRVRVIGSCYRGVGGIEGMTFRITNIATQPLPEYDVAMYHHGRGTICYFDSTGKGELLPDQERRHSLPVLINGQPCKELLSWFGKIEGKPVAHPNGDGLLFRLVLKSSDKVLYENPIMGKALGNAIMSGCTTGKVGHFTHEQSMALQDVDRKYRAAQRKELRAEGLI